MRKKKTITILESHEKWLKEKNISLSRFVQEKIEKEIEKELLEKERVYEP